MTANREARRGSEAVSTTHRERSVEKKKKTVEVASHGKICQSLQGLSDSLVDTVLVRGDWQC